MSLREQQSEFMKDLERLLRFAHGRGFEVTGGELERTQEMQDIYIKRGYSKTRNSYHLRRLAIDLYFFLDGNLIKDKEILQPIGDYWESLNKLNAWGGNWKTFYDPVHFERRWRA